MEADRAERIAAVHRDLALLTAEPHLPPRAARERRSESAVSTVFTVRLDRDELEALQRHAQVRGMKPSVLARNFIRVGLTEGGSDAMASVIDRLEDAVAELRAVAP
ncbi:MAG: hypothetical protein ACRDWT_11360 [Jatrophihabitantaceae bacterium]